MARASLWFTVAVCGLLLRSAAPDTAQAAAASDDQLFDRATLRVEPGFHTAAATCIAASRDGSRVATGSEDRTIRLWDSRGELLRTLRPPSALTGEEGVLYAVALSPDGRLLAAAGTTRFFDERAGTGSSVYLFDTSSGALLKRFAGQADQPRGDRIERLLFSPDGKRLGVRRSAIRSFGLYDVASGAVLDDPLPWQGKMYRDLDWDGAGQLLLTRPSAVDHFDATLHEKGSIRDLPWTFGARFLPDGKQLVIIFGDGKVELRKRPGGKPVPPIPLGAELPALTAIKSATLSTDGKELFIAGQVDSTKRYVVRRLTLAPKGPARDIELPQIVAQDLAALPAGGVAFAAADGSWGVLEEGGTIVRHGTSWVWNAPPDALRVDPTGDEIEVRLGPRPTERLRFAVSSLELKPAPSTDPRMRAPILEPKPPHRISGWQHSPPVYLDGEIIVRYSEDPSALAISHSGSEFFLGTSKVLASYHFERVPNDGCAKPFTERAPATTPCFIHPVSSPVRSLNYSGDGRFVLALLADGTVRWFDARDGSEKLALSARPGDGRFLLFRPDGLHAASPGGGELAGFQINEPNEAKPTTFFPLSRLKKRYERTEEVAATLTGGTAAAATPGTLRRAELPPVLTILEPADGATVTSTTLTVKIATHSLSDQPTTGFGARIDGRTIRVAQPRGIVDMAQKDAQKKDAPPKDAPAAAQAPAPVASSVNSDGDSSTTITLTIPERDCVVALFAENSAGAGPPALLRLRWRGATGQAAPGSAAKAPAGPQPRGSLRVLAIGVDDYRQTELRLRYPGKDALDLTKLLTELQARAQKGAGPLYQSVDVKLVAGRKATKAAILEALDWLQHRATASDTTILFLAGHGINEPSTGEYFFLPADANQASPMATMLPASTLRQVLSNVLGRVVLLLDTCHSGNVLGNSGRKTRGLPPLSRAIAELSSVDGGIVVMAAATGQQASIEDAAWQNGAFAKAVIEGLSGRADARKTGRVTVNMLDLYVSERVRELTEGSQTPATAKPSTIADFPLVLSQ